MALMSKAAIVTGAAQGIGKAIAARLVKDGMRVAIVDINQEAAVAAAEELAGQYGADTMAVQCDVSQEEQVNIAVQKVLERFGYLVGRYVYFADALDDLDDDRKSGSYNPFLKKFEGTERTPEEIRDYAKEVLNLTIGEIAPAYELLSLRRYKSILDNIIYLGLPDELELILTHPKKDRPRDEKSLAG